MRFPFFIATEQAGTQSMLTNNFTKREDIRIVTMAAKLKERLFYIKCCAEGHFTIEPLKRSLAADYRCGILLL